jgi:hypothetical protein
MPHLHQPRIADAIARQCASASNTQSGAVLTLLWVILVDYSESLVADARPKGI